MDLKDKPLSKHGKYKPSKSIQLRMSSELHTKIRERAYLSLRSIQSILLEIVEKEFEK